MTSCPRQIRRWRGEITVTEGSVPGQPVGTARQARRQQQALREILDAASEELRLHGPSGVTMRGVARRVDLTPSGLYRHVSDHRELLALLTAEAYEALAAAMTGARDRAPEGDPATAWYLVATAMRDWYVDHVPEYELLVSPRLFDHPTGRLSAVARGSLQLLCDICAEAIEAGQLDPRVSGFPAAADHADDPEVAARVIAMSALAALSGHLGFELRGAFLSMPMGPEEHFIGYVRSTMRLMGFVVEAAPPDLT